MHITIPFPRHTKFHIVLHHFQMLLCISMYDNQPSSSQNKLFFHYSCHLTYLKKYLNDIKLICDNLCIGFENLLKHELHLSYNLK